MLTFCIVYSSLIHLRLRYRNLMYFGCLQLAVRDHCRPGQLPLHRDRSTMNEDHVKDKIEQIRFLGRVLPDLAFTRLLSTSQPTLSLFKEQIIMPIRIISLYT